MKRQETRPGAFVVLVGPDGVGKTSVARALLDLHHGPVGYVHFRPSVFRRLASGPGASELGTRPKAAPSGSMVGGWARAAFSLIRFWVAYLLRVRPAVRRGSLVVGDRWGFGYHAQPSSLRFFGPAWLGRLVVRLLPRPTVVANLTAPVDVILSRKQELTPHQIRSELRLWSSLPVPRVLEVDATPDPDTVAREVYEAVFS